MIRSHPILVPVLALIAWSMIVMIWMMITRFKAFKKAGIVPTNVARGTRGPDLEPRLDPHAVWKAHNYNHLMEQPTIFYALCLTIAVAGLQTGASLVLAWAYFGLRVGHSLVQATINIVLFRSILFALSSLSLLILTVLTLWRALGPT